MIWSWKRNEEIVSRKEWLIELVAAAGSNKTDEGWELYKGGFRTTIENLKVGASQLCVFLLISMALNPPQLLPALLWSVRLVILIMPSVSFVSVTTGAQLANLLRARPSTALHVSASLLSPVNLPDSSLRILYMLEVLTECSFNLLPRAVGTKTHLTFESLLPSLLFYFYFF